MSFTKRPIAGSTIVKSVYGKITVDPNGEWRKVVQEEAKKFPPDKKKGNIADIPRPYLKCSNNFWPQIKNGTQYENTKVSFEIWNEGTLASWTCYVELYEGPPFYNRPLSEYQLRGQVITTLQAGERQTVSIDWVRRFTWGRMLGVVHDPLLDPLNFEGNIVDLNNRHATNFAYKM